MGLLETKKNNGGTKILLVPLKKRPWVLNWNLTQPQHFTHFNCSMTTCSNTDVLRPRPSDPADRNAR